MIMALVNLFDEKVLFTFVEKLVVNEFLGYILKFDKART